MTVNVVKVFTTVPGNVGKVLAQDPAAGHPLNADGGTSTATITVGKMGIIQPPLPTSTTTYFIPHPPLVPLN